MKKEIRYELVTCPECEGKKYIKIESCSCVGCETINTCSNCNSKGVIKVVRYAEKASKNN